MAIEYSHHLGDLFVSSREKGKKGLPHYSVTLHDGLVLRSSLERRTDTNIEDRDHLLIKKGYIAYNMMRVWQGALGKASVDGIVSPAYIVLKPTEYVDSQYAEYLFKSLRMIYLFWAYSYGLTNDRLRLYYRDFARIKVKIPDLPEQRKIAKILQTWDRAIATTEKLINASKQQKKALMQQLLTGKKRFAGFEGEWNLKTVAEFGRVVTGCTPPRNFTGHYGGSFSWATAEDFKNKYVANTKTKLTPSGVKTVRIVPKGSVLVTCIASIGKNAIAGEDLATNQQINSVVINNENSNEFFYYVICFSNSKLLSWAGTTAVPILNKSSFEKIPLPAPKIDEQRRVAQVLKSADCELDLLRSRLTHLKQEKKALMQQLLTGKRRVKVDAL